MSLMQAYKGLSSKARCGFGVGLLVWGALGLYMSDRVEEKYGLTPSEEDKAELDKMKPTIRVVDREKRS